MTLSFGDHKVGKVLNLSQFPNTRLRPQMIHYRVATFQDVELIAQLHTISWQVNYKGIWPDVVLGDSLLADRRQIWQQRLSQPVANQHTVVTFSGETLCGFACAYGNDDPTWGTLLDNLHIAPGYQGQGIGTTLIKSIANWSYLRHPACGLFLWVLQENKPAKRFYERLGAIEEGTDIHDFPPGNQSVVCRYVWPNLISLLHL